MPQDYKREFLYHKRWVVMICRIRQVVFTISGHLFTAAPIPAASSCNYAVEANPHLTSFQLFLVAIDVDRKQSNSVSSVGLIILRSKDVGPWRILACV